MDSIPLDVVETPDIEVTDVDATTDVDMTTDIEAASIDMDVDMDMAGVSGMDNGYSANGVSVIEGDADDNAGDADANGDGSACMEDQFMEYASGGNSKDEEDTVPRDEDSASYGESKVLSMSMLVAKSLVCAQIHNDLYLTDFFMLLMIQDGVLRDARYAVEHFDYEPIVQNPFNKSMRPRSRPQLQSEPGIMTYRQARIILRSWDVTGLKFMRPYLEMWHHYGTTLPHIIKKKRIVTTLPHILKKQRTIK